MFIFNLTNPLILFLTLLATVMFILLGKETKRSLVIAVPLFLFLIMLIVHVIQVLTLTPQFEYLFPTLSFNIALDLVFVLLTFISYLWLDDVEARAFGKKSIDNSLDWFWKKV